MKKILCGLMVSALLSGGVLANNSEVYSRNAVGFVKVEVPRGQYFMLQTPFDQMDGAPAAIADLLGVDLPVLTRAYIWPEDQSGWSVATLREMMGIRWWDPQGLTIDRGRGFYLYVPPGDPSGPGTIEVTFMGEVPTEVETTVDIVEGFQMLGHAFPSSIAFTETDLYSSARVGDVLYVHGQDGLVSHTVYSMFGSTFFSPSVDEVILKPGLAFFYRSQGDDQWKQSRPYPLWW